MPVFPKIQFPAWTRPRGLLALAVAGIALLAGCGGDAPQEEHYLEPPDPIEGPPPPPLPQGPGPGVIELTLTPMPGLSAGGTVTLTAQDDEIVAEVSAHTGIGPAELGLHIHEGTCAEGGRVVVGLTPVQTDAAGEGTSITTFPADRLSYGNLYFVMLHEPDGEPIACVELDPFHI
jgi:hypothetical protein